jgi:hypothetical protein
VGAPRFMAEKTTTFCIGIAIGDDGLHR